MPTVLVVDDEPAIRRALGKVFARGGMDVVEANSGRDALELLATGVAVDAAVCDVVMPGGSGLDLYDRLTHEAPQLVGHVVFLTGLAHDPAVHGPIEARGVPLVSKLDDLMIVVDAVRLALLR